ncbi:MAG: TonB-dependent receptor [Calditrichia bacterium]|nr:TonB-dependent receptor [Calditrichia bacterium]
MVLLKLKQINSTQKFTISGFLSDAKTGEALIGTNIYIKKLLTGCTSNVYGFYSLTVPAGRYKIVYSFIGYKTKVMDIILKNNNTANIELETSPFISDTVFVTASREENFVKNTEIGTISLSPQKLSSMPVLFGEQDILKTLHLLPGVTLQREGDSGFNVRGGNSDQNLILLDEAPVYNAFHFFGFFSVFNSDAIKNVKLIKGSAPPKYGGKLSSVLDIQMNEGNFKKFHGNGGIGLIFSRLTLEGPIKKDKSSFIISGRRTYADVFTRLSSMEEVQKSTLYFYDFNLKTNYRLNHKNRFYLSGYFGRDVLGYSGIFKNSWGNETATFRWNHLFNDKLFLNSSLIMSNFKYSMNVTPEEDENDDSIEIKNNIKDFTIKEDFQYYPDTHNTFNFGLQFVHHTFLPGEISSQGDSNFDIEIGKRKAREYILYLSHEITTLSRLKINYGLRYNRFSVDSKGDSFNFSDMEDLPDFDFHEKDKITYDGFEPRITANFEWNETTSFKLGYARNYQNIHLLSNSTSGTPLDVWQPSSRTVKPQRSEQYSFGYFRNLLNKTYELSVEVFYKDMINQVDFENGADIFMSTLFESELVFGSGRAYGIEFLLKKRLGKLTGWAGYSLSKTEKKFNEINQGKPFPAKFDRTHDLSFVGLYKFNRKWTLGINFVYYTGNATTVPYGKYKINGKIINAYTERNAFRLPAYHRLDINLTYYTRKGHNWNFSVYNAYGRKNTYALLFRSDNPDPLRLAIFSFVPSISYNFKF